MSTAAASSVATVDIPIATDSDIEADETLVLVVDGPTGIEGDLEGTPSGPLVAEILDASERASTLTRQLLAFSRQQTLRPEVVQLPDVDRKSVV